MRTNLAQVGKDGNVLSRLTALQVTTPIALVSDFQIRIAVV